MSRQRLSVTAPAAEQAEILEAMAAILAGHKLAPGERLSLSVDGFRDVADLKRRAAEALKAAS